MNKVWKDYYRVKNTQVFEGGHEYILQNENVRNICDTILNDIKFRNKLLMTAEVAGTTVSWNGKSHYLLSNLVLVGEAVALAMRTLRD